MKQSKIPNLILASASPRRRQLMKAGGYKFTVIPSDASERYSKNLKPSQIVQYLAKKKALSVAKLYPDSVVMGADTLVFIRGKVIGKPKNPLDARKILKTLSNSWQKVYSGVAVVWEGGKRIKVGYAVSTVKIRELSDSDIRHASKHHMDKAGAYAVQQKNDPFVEKMTGDYDNVVGLPMRVVKKLFNSVR